MQFFVCIWIFFNFWGTFFSTFLLKLWKFFALIFAKKTDEKVNSFSTDLEIGKLDLWPLSSLHMTRHNGGMESHDGVSYRSVQHKRRGENGFPLVLDRNTTTFLEACCYSSFWVENLHFLKMSKFSKKKSWCEKSQQLMITKRCKNHTN